MSTLDKSKLEHFKQLFLTREQEIILANSNRSEDIDVDGGDEVDIIQRNLLKSMMEKLSMRDKDSLKRIKDALSRIEDGSFGECESCGDAIPEKRLSAVPYCTTCVDCAEQAEHRIKQYRL